ncbi:ZrgA family zinc uptake protein [Endozoicomonas elysicola]|uniref:Uncharacterized protein n=1 Tax=Endozoicomonas elysicola TaxID=305900 RepID=A0A081KFE9_9GAMM|nr:DUF2796 domain-containing protein [Endozoicomonas elysicola]KEI72875.1 hypothetical protein GV64_21030 [Endozoicomonas elysicola]
MRARIGAAEEVVTMLLLVMTFSVLPAHAEESAPGQRLHRAYEPASIQLDINLQRETLSLFLSMNPEAARTITRKPIHSLANHLNEFSPLATLPDDAGCKQTQKQFLVEPADSLSPSTNSPATTIISQQITGYLEYECENPEELSHLKFRGFKAMPGLKHASVWLISDSWQSKQQLSQKQKRVQLQKKRSLTHILWQLLND